MKQLASALLALLFLLTPAYAAEADSGGVCCFSPEDFSDETLTGVCITAVPASKVWICFFTAGISCRSLSST